MSKSVVGSSIRNITPTRAFFRATQPVPSLAHARQVIKSLAQYGDLVEYKVMRCSETQKPLRYGFVVFKHQEDAKKAFNDQFIKVDSDLFEQPCELKVEAAKSLH